MTIELGRVGIWSPAWDVTRIDPGLRREGIALLDELGYGAAWFGMANPDLQLLGDLLAESKRIVLASGIINIWAADAGELTARYHEVAASFPDRLLIGLGASHAPIVEQSGQSYTKPYSKVVSFLDELDAQPQPLPVDARVLAALGPRVVTLAGQRSLGAHPYLTTPEHTAWAREILGDGPLLAPEQMVVLETDPERARAIARDTLAMYLQLPNYLNNLRRFGFTDDDFVDGGTDRLVDALVPWGEPEAVSRRIREHHDAGANHVCVQVLTGGGGLPMEQWRLLAEAMR